MTEKLKSIKVIVFSVIFIFVGFQSNSAFAWEDENTIAIAIHRAFFGNNPQSSNGVTVAVGLASPNNVGEEWVYYVATGATTINFPATTQLGITIAGQNIPAGTPRLEGILRIANAVLTLRNRQFGPGVWLAVITGNGPPGTEQEIAGAGNFERVVQITLPGRGPAVHAEMAIAMAHANGWITDEFGHDLEAVAANRAYCHRCWHYLRATGVNMRPNFINLNFGPNWDRPGSHPESPAGVGHQTITLWTYQYLASMLNTHPGVSPWP